MHDSRSHQESPNHAKSNDQVSEPAQVDILQGRKLIENPDVQTLKKRNCKSKIDGARQGSQDKE